MFIMILKIFLEVHCNYTFMNNDIRTDGNMWTEFCTFGDFCGGVNVDITSQVGTLAESVWMVLVIEI